MKYLFWEYPPCSTCRKARQWLLDNDIEFETRNIVGDGPSEEELKELIKISGREPRSFFNTGGLKYRALGLKGKLGSLSIEEQIRLLASDGMLLKRPLFVGGKTVLSGFHPEIWKQLKQD